MVFVGTVRLAQKEAAGFHGIFDILGEAVDCRDCRGTLAGAFAQFHLILADLELHVGHKVVSVIAINILFKVDFAVALRKPTHGADTVETYSIVRMETYRGSKVVRVGVVE